MHQDNRYSVLQYGSVQLGPWDVANDGALNDCVGLCATDHSWASSKWMVKLSRAALVYAILEAPFATLGYLRNLLRIGGQFLHEWLA